MILDVVKYGDPILTKRSEEVSEFDDKLRKLIDNMFETMYGAPGVGLAAAQVGVLKRLFVMDCSSGKDKKKKLVLINPVIETEEGEQIGEEGCLSFPDITAEIDRSTSVAVEAETLDGDRVEIEASGLLARALQHEVDHLNGILFIDRMNSAAKVSHSSRLKRLQKETTRL